jgi:hypothetical protein
MSSTMPSMSRLTTMSGPIGASCWRIVVFVLRAAAAGERGSAGGGAAGAGLARSSVSRCGSISIVI